MAEWVAVDVRNVPVDRVTANLERELTAKPNDARLLVNLARVHSMAFAQRRDTVLRDVVTRAWPADQKGGIAPGTSTIHTMEMKSHSRRRV